MDFARTFGKFRQKAQKSRYRLAQYCGVDEAYILRLESGERRNPSRDLVIMLALALVENSTSVSIFDVDELLLSASYAPLTKRGVVQQAISA